MNDEPSSFKRVSNAFWDSVPHWLASAIVGAVALLLGWAGATQFALWGLARDIADNRNTLESTELCQRVRDCPWHRSVEDAIARFNAHIATGDFVREQVKRNAEQIHDCLMNCQPKKGP